VSIDYDLAPCQLIKDETCDSSGRPPEQTDDVKNAIRALRADTTDCNGKIGVVGGSAGGFHAVFCSLDKTPSGGDGNSWPYWFKDGHDDRADCTVSLSGAYNLADRTPEAYGDPSPLLKFSDDVANYVGSDDLTAQKMVSVVSLSIDAASFKPLFLINSQFDPMPYHQIVDMICALRSASVSTSAYKTMTIMGSDEHSFAIGVVGTA
jgi:acetyl esterase/lipase